MKNTTSATFDEEWRTAVAAHSDRTFLLFRSAEGDDSDWTYGEFDQIVQQAQARLGELGIRSGDAVHLCLSNCPAFLVLWFAVARMGAWMVPVDPSSSANDLASQVQRTSARVSFIDESAADRATTLPAGHTTVFLSQTAEDLRPGGPLSPVTADPHHSGPRSPESTSPGPLDRLAVMFTSGTTSQPKGVVLTQANYGYTARTMARLAHLEAHHRWIVSLPLFHGNAQFYCVASAIAVGASVALTARFSASGWVRDTAELRATHASLFAAPIRMVLARMPEDAPRPSLTHVWFAQNLSPGQYDEFAHTCGVRPRQLYGMTETTAVVTCQPIGQESHDAIGTVVPGRSVRIDDASGTPGDSGLLKVVGRRGIDLFLEYLDAPDITERVFAPEGTPAADDLGIDSGNRADDRRATTSSIFTTGDIVDRDATGNLRFSGRADDIIKVAGENVSLAEVEAVLSAAPGVLEVAVIAIPDPVRDVVPQAHVVSRDPRAPVSRADLEEYAALHLPKAARPRSWVFPQELPRTSVGKIRKFTLVPPSGAAPGDE